MDKVTSLDIKKALSHKHCMDFFTTECKSGSTWLTPAGSMKILDALAIKKSWANPCFTGYEVKISRGDFLRDAKFYTYEEIVNCLYVVCPKGMIDRTELPESVGLMYFDPASGVLTTKKKAIYRKIEYSPEMLLYIIYSKLDSDRIPFYSDKRAYFEDYLAEKRSGRAFGKVVGSKLLEKNLALEQMLKEVSHFKDRYEEYRALNKVLEKHHIWGWGSEGISMALDKALDKKCPDDITDIRADLERIVSKVRKMEESQEAALSGVQHDAT